MNDIIKKIGKGMLMAALLLSSSCQSDEPANGGGSSSEGDGGNVSAVTFTLSTRPAKNPTRAVGEVPGTGNELMQSWRVLFVQKDASTDNDKVIAIVKWTADGSDITSYKENDSFNVTLEDGEYDIYAFANLSEYNASIGSENPKIKAILDLQQNDVIPASTFETINLYGSYSKEDLAIPMSRHMKFTKSGNNGTEIELIRMLGKVEFEFINDASTDLTVTGVTFAPLYDYAVNFMPRFTLADNSISEIAVNKTSIVANPTIPDGAASNTGTVTFTTPATLPVKPDNDIATSVYRHFYVHETSAVKETGRQFYFSVKLKRGNGDTEEQRFALTGNYTEGESSTKLTNIRRNDYIQIPVKLTDYNVILKAISYPPIGGYPANVEKDGDNVFYATFYTPGKFKLLPSVFKGNDATKPLTSDKVTITNGSVISDPDGILKPSTVNGETVKIVYEGGELIGTIIDNQLGTAELSVTFDVKDESIVRTFTRKIYITRTTK